jgi:hypothetical protein
MIESFKTKLWTFKDDCNNKAWNWEMANKKIAKFVNSCVNFAFANFNWSTTPYFHFSNTYPKEFH